MLFASTTIRTIWTDRLFAAAGGAPYLKISYHWTNSDYADIVIAFRVAYAIGQTISGRWLDRVGTRLGITITVLFYSDCLRAHSAGEWVLQLSWFSLHAGNW